MTIFTLSPDIVSTQEFINKSLDQEADKKMASRLKEQFEQLRIVLDQEVKKFKSQKENNRKVFNREYSLLLKSYGQEGNYPLLSKTSNKGDEPALKKLRETILQRNSDECFEDYHKISRIILFNRFIN